MSVVLQGLFAGRLAHGWWRPVAVAFCLCWLAVEVGPSPAVDRRIADRLLAAQNLPADRTIVLVEIGPEDVRRYGRPYLYRENLALLLEKLKQAGAQRVLLDTFIGESIDPAGELKLEQAVAAFGRDRIALVSGVLAQDQPLAHIARHATVVDGRLTPDSDGWHRDLVRNGKVKGTNPATWLASGRVAQVSTPLDLRIDHTAFPRLSATEVLTGRPDLAGRLVIVGVGPDVAPTRAFLPFAPTASRVSVLAMAVQAELAGYRETAELGGKVEAGLYASSFLLGLAVALWARTGRQFVGWLAGSGLLLLALEVALPFGLGVANHPSQALACLFLVANVMIVHRLRIRPMIVSLMRGDVSPDEAWAWRAHEESTLPAILFSADGTIKRCNPAARELARAHGSALAALCLPRIGERADGIDLPGDNGVRVPYALDWPQPKVPIAVLRDQSEIESLERSLHQQLYTDELTGVANRRGFERALVEAAARSAAYHLYFIDLNGFKQVNDTHGHAAGDEVLAVCAARLARIVRDEDVVARLGGDEFAVLLPAVPNEFDPAAQAERMARVLSEPIRLPCAGLSVSVGAAVGHACPAGGQECSTDVVRRADLAMYRRKSDMKAAGEPLAA